MLEERLRRLLLLGLLSHRFPKHKHQARNLELDMNLLPPTLTLQHQYLPTLHHLLLPMRRWSRLITI